MLRQTKYQTDENERIRIKRNNKRFLETHPEWVQKQALKDKVRIKAYRKNKYATDPKFRAKCIANNHLYQQKLRGLKCGN